MTRVPRAAAVDPLVLAVDVGSTATRGDVYDAAGRPVEGGRCKMPHQFVTAADGTSQIDPNGVVEEVAQVIGQLAGRWRARRIAAVALDTFASSLVGVRPDGSAATPCYTYADSRCAEQVVMLRGELDEPAIQQRTGCRLHTSYLAPRLRWLQATQPAAFTAATRWMSVGEYVYLRLLGTTAAGTSIAAWTGLLDRRTGRWDDELVAAAGLRAGQLSEIRDPTEAFDDAGPVIGSRWPALASSVWLPVVADGIAGPGRPGAAECGGSFGKQNTGAAHGSALDVDPGVDFRVEDQAFTRAPRRGEARACTPSGSSPLPRRSAPTPTPGRCSTGLPPDGCRTAGPGHRPRSRPTVRRWRPARGRTILTALRRCCPSCGVARRTWPRATSPRSTASLVHPGGSPDRAVAGQPVRPDKALPDPGGCA